MAKSPNVHLETFLEYYLQPSNDLGYAVLISGPWGSGKTHVIKRFLERSRAKHLYVSLNGVTSVRQIEEELFQQLHPVLASKGMRLFTAALRGAVKATLRIDLDGDSKEDVSLSAQLPTIDLVKDLGEPKQYLLVFDDLERCAIPLPAVLGFINAFVEQDGLKALVLANEGEGDTGTDQYKRIKEKLFGQTLRVRPDSDSAFDRFVADIGDREVQTFLRAKKEVIVALHKESGTENLRLLKHALGDFARIGSALEPRHWNREAATVDLLKITMALSFEVRGGGLNRDQIPSVIGMDYGRYFRRHEQESKAIDQLLEEKYPDTPFQRVILVAESLQRFLFDGWVDAEAIRSEIERSPSFGDEKSLPTWRKAWSFFELPDDEFDVLVQDLEAEFDARSLNDPGPLLHIFGLRLFLADMGAISESRSATVVSAKRYIDDLAAKGRIANTVETPYDTTSFDGLGFHERDTPEFRKILAYYEAAMEEATRAAYPRFAADLLKKMATEPDEFLADVAPNSIRSPRFAQRPILAALAPNDFVNGLLSAPPTAQTKIFRALQARYEFGQLEAKLKPEQRWLREVGRLLNQAARTAKPNTRNRLTSMTKHVIDPVTKRVPRPKKQQKGKRSLEQSPADASPKE